MPSYYVEHSFEAAKGVVLTSYVPRLYLPKNYHALAVAVAVDFVDRM
jgi:hypothetical protein